MSDNSTNNPATNNGFDRKDRDLLIELNTRVTDLIKVIEKMDTNILKDIGGLRDSKAEKTALLSCETNHDKDILRMTTEFNKVWVGVNENEKAIKTHDGYIKFGLGALAILQFLIPLGMKFIRI